METEKTPWYKRPLSGWKLWGALALVLVVGFAVGASASTQKQETIDDLEQELAATNDELDEAVRDKDDYASLLSDARADAKSAEKKAEKKLAAREAELEQKTAEQQAELEDREAAVSDAEQTLEANTIPDGIWQAGRDFEPGLYRAPGGQSCYWATLDSANTSDIADNGLGKNPTVQIDTPFFESQDCGEWTKIG